MFKKVLIPTDGSSIATSAAQAGIEFAKQVGAEVIAIFVAPEYQYPLYVEMVPPSFPTKEEYLASMQKAGETCLKPVEEAAQAASIKFSGITSISDATAKEIVHAAKNNHCDLIFMGSHGRSGWSQALLGSVTNKVLASCPIPVLVYRLPVAEKKVTEEEE